MSLSPDPAMAPILERLRAAPAVDYRTIPIAQARAIFEDGNRPWNAAPPQVFEVHELEAPGASAPLRARLFLPTPEVLPVILYLHGGGWTFGSIDSHDATMRRLARAANAAVLGIDYRLAPENPYPAGLDDALAVLAFLERGGLDASIDTGRLAVAGDSSGANLALATLLARRNARLPALSGAALFYGCFAPDFETASHLELGDGRFLLSTEIMRWYWGNYLGPEPLDTVSLATPLRRDLSGLPPLYLCAAGLDPLRSDTLALSGRLAEAGVLHRFDFVPGVVHGFLRMANELPAAAAALCAAGEFLKARFKSKAVGGIDET